jgi:hypothetical protein
LPVRTAYVDGLSGQREFARFLIFLAMPLVRRRAASALRRVVGTPLVPTISGGHGAQGVSKTPRPRARRERSHAQPRPFFTDGAARGEHPLFDTPEHRGSRAFPTAAFAALMACVGNAA